MLLILLPKYYITGDGPSHTYNAKVFIDYLLGNNREFYKPFYEINRNLDPNWTAQILLGILVKCLPYWLADKAIQIIYVCVFSFGFRYLISTINNSATSISLLFYPICFTLPFQMGFYNYSIALGLLFWIIAFYIKNKNSFSGLRYLLLCIALLVLALTHGMVATFCIAIICIMLLQETISSLNNKTSFVDVVNKHSMVLMAMLPACILIVSFTMRQGLLTSPHPFTITQKIINFCKLYCCQSTSNLEVIPAILFGFGLVVLSLLIFSNNKCIQPALRNIFLLFVVLTFLLYLRSPDTIGYAGGTDIRTAFLPIVFLLLAIACYPITINIQRFIMGFALVITSTFLAIRTPAVLSASAEAKQTLQLLKDVQPNSTILTIQYNTHGAANQFKLDNSMLHIFDYAGAMPSKNLIILNNYEADLNYFSIKWRNLQNPKLCMPGIIHGLPPTAQQILDYQYQTKHAINYIVLQKDTRRFVDTKIKIGPDTAQQSLIQFIDTTYNPIATNTDLGITVYQKK